MWKTAFQAFIQNPVFCQPIRTTYVVKRKWPARLVSAGRWPSLRKKHFIYETLSDNTETPGKINVLLLKYVEDIGRPGEVVSIKENNGRFLIMTKAAEYASADNVAKIGKSVELDEINFSSRYVGHTVRALSEFVLNISMNKENPWTLEPWHIRSAFRKAHVHVPENCFTMPTDPISGPDMALEGKEFIITVTINNKEKVPVRCRIHHWSTDPQERLPPVRDHWKFPADLILPKDEEIAKTLPPLIPPELVPDDGPPALRNKKKRFG
jgi:large subunit ribosomal protein L9